MSSLKNKLRTSIREETKSVKDRFTQAESLMNQYPDGLANPPVADTKPKAPDNLSETTLGAPSDGLRISRKKSRKKDICQQYRITKENHKVGYIKEWDSGKIVFKVTLTNPKERAKLIDDLKSRFIPDKK